MITRHQQQLILQAHQRHGRRKHGVFLAEGVRCCREALQGWPGHLLAVACTKPFADSAEGRDLAALLPAGQELSPLADAEFGKLAATENPQGILCLFHSLPDPPPLTAWPRPYALVLDRVQEPGNLGTILRTAWAAGLQEVWLTEGCTDPFNPKAIRAGMGAQFSIFLRVFPALVEVRSALLAHGGKNLWGAVPSGGVSCFSPVYAPDGNALVIGNEANGIAPADLAFMEKVTIPMPGHAESLNAAQAATILLFEGVRRHSAS